jgi:HEAT repeat protein
MTMTENEKRQVLAGLNGRTQMLAFEAATAIWRDPDPSLERPLISILTHGRRPLNRAAAAFAMQILKTQRGVKALERSVKNRSEHPRVRGEAAEALAHGHRKMSHDVLLKELGDPSKNVRFWCAFALGEMAERRAVPALKRLAATDKRIVKGLHSVAKEAADAIRNIRKNDKRRRRKSSCVFCARD